MIGHSQFEELLESRFGGLPLPPYDPADSPTYPAIQLLDWPHKLRKPIVRRPSDDDVIELHYRRLHTSTSAFAPLGF